MVIGDEAILVTSGGSGLSCCNAERLRVSPRGIAVSGGPIASASSRGINELGHTALIGNPGMFGGGTAARSERA